MKGTANTVSATAGGVVLSTMLVGTFGTLLTLRDRAKNADERTAGVGAVFGALPDGFTKNQVEVRGEVNAVIENL